jgi:hypothetical protein
MPVEVLDREGGCHDAEAVANWCLGHFTGGNEGESVVPPYTG